MSKSLLAKRMMACTQCFNTICTQYNLHMHQHNTPVASYLLQAEQSFLTLAFIFFNSSRTANMFINLPRVRRQASETKSFFFSLWQSLLTSPPNLSMAFFYIHIVISYRENSYCKSGLICQIYNFIYNHDQSHFEIHVCMYLHKILQD